MGLLAPELRAVGNLDQLTPNNDFFTEPHDPDHHHGLDVQLKPNCLRVEIFAFEAEDGAAGKHTQLWNAREHIDDALSDAVRQIFDIRIAAGHLSRKDGE